VRGVSPSKEVRALSPTRDVRALSPTRDARSSSSGGTSGQLKDIPSPYSISNSKSDSSIVSIIFIYHDLSK
jgi:hypothetical protein